MGGHRPPAVTRRVCITLALPYRSHVEVCALVLVCCPADEAFGDVQSHQGELGGEEG